ncbi:MAG TPA: hypothetical protein VMI75_24945 [Polyangiaceae bacterium]|nr:hypothetical protein [Polyangiaceae bacterium]
MALVIAPTRLDPALLRQALVDASSVTRLREALARRPDLAWERELVDAACSGDDAARESLLGEPMSELDWSLERWDRVPRVCASVASSVGFLCATVAVIEALAMPEDPEAGTALGRVLAAALCAFAVGLVGTSFCAAVHLRTRGLAKAKVAAADRLVERLRALAT